jgi:hypothetical protein
VARSVPEPERGDSANCPRDRVCPATACGRHATPIAFPTQNPERLSCYSRRPRHMVSTGYAMGKQARARRAIQAFAHGGSRRRGCPATNDACWRAHRPALEDARANVRAWPCRKPHGGGRPASRPGAASHRLPKEPQKRRRLPARRHARCPCGWRHPGWRTSCWRCSGASQAEPGLREAGAEGCWQGAGAAS